MEHYSTTKRNEVLIHTTTWMNLKNTTLRSQTGEGNSTLLQYSCLENPMDGRALKAAIHGVAEGAWWAAVYGVAQSRKRLN